MRGTEETDDLLALIERAIDGLTLAVRRFEAEDPRRAVAHVRAVIRAIDHYAAHLDGDPLLRGAPIPCDDVRATLSLVREDLSGVVDDCAPSTSPAARPS